MAKIRVYVAGHRGMVGSAIVRQLEKDDTVEIITRSRDELDLTNQAAVNEFFTETKIEQVYLAAAKVGGIYANNTYPAEFIYENLMIEANVIHAAFKAGVKKFLFLGSSCIYPRDAEQPMKEDALLTGKLEPTNEPYAIAKIAGIKLCESYNRQYGISHDIDYRTVMPTNLFGPGDNYHPENSHVVPALLRKFHEAKVTGQKNVVIWGSGEPLREFLYVDDMAAACVYVMNVEGNALRLSTQPSCSFLNVGSGQEISIANLAELIRDLVGYSGTVSFDRSKPDGSPRKLMDHARLRELGWSPHFSLKKALELTYGDYLNSL